MDDVAGDPRIHSNLLIFEIGNSHVSVATTIAGTVRTNHRFNLEQMDEIAAHSEDAWAALPPDHIKALAAAGVVPEVMDRLRERIESTFNETLHVVGDDLHRPMSLAVEAPEMVGIDRICAASAAYEGVGGACAVASFGTAITVDCVNEQGVFLGGAILPGLALQARALHEGTAALPEVAVEQTGAIFGTTTQEAISNGILYGVAGALREIVERYATHLGNWPVLIATGGNAELISRECDFIDRVVPDLCIRGIALAYRKHFAPMPDSW